MHNYLFSLVVFLLFPLAYVQAEESVFSGLILDEQGKAIENVSIRLNENQIQTDVKGYYRADADQSDLVRLVISAEGFYPVLHTFAGRELVRDKDGYRVPPIVLVRKKPGRVMMAFGGDAMMGRRFKDPERGEPQLIRPGSERTDAEAVLAYIAPYMSVADFASVNMETPLMDNKPKAAAPKSYVFYSPTAMLAAMEASGIDFVSLGNNHVNDFVEEGAASTMNALQNSRIGYAGGGMNEQSALTAWRQQINGVNTSHLGFVGWKGKVIPNQVADGPDKSGAAYGSDDNIRATVSREDKAGDLVVMQYHGSSEYSYGPSKNTERRMKLAVDNGADLVIGHHPHVVHGFEIYQDKLIAYSLGNFVFDQYRYETHPSAILYVWMDGDKFHRAEVVPLYVKGYRPTPAVGKIREYVLKRLVDQSARRGLILSRSGGHAVITPDIKPLQKAEIHQINGGASIMRLEASWDFYPSAPEAVSGEYRLGRDRLLFGDFEQQGLWGLADNNWSHPVPSCAIQSETVYSGKYALCLAAEKKTELRNFVRTHDYEPGTPLTLHGFIRAEKQADLIVSLAFWDQGTARAAALKQPRQAELGRVTATTGQWTEFSIRFPAPDRKKVKGFKLVFENDSGEKLPMYLDDLSLIEWQQAGPNKKSGQAANPLFRMNFLELNKKPDEPGVIKIRGYSSSVATGEKTSTQTTFMFKDQN